MGCRGNGYNLVLSQISQDLRSPRLPGGSVSEESACVAGDHLQCRRPRFDPWVGKIPWRRIWQPTPVFLPGKSHEQRSLVGYSPWGRKELTLLSDFTHSLTHQLICLSTQDRYYKEYLRVGNCTISTTNLPNSR